jgi:hypothetical protein
MAKRRYGLSQIPDSRRELSSEIALRAFNISISTRTESDKVEALILPYVKYEHGF